jgi:signal transduction histidine kinase
VQESLTNVVKHAHARAVSIILARKVDAVAVVIEDDGRGFDPATCREDGFGLEGMRERAGLLEGKFQVESREGGGTTIVAEVPLL